MLLSKGFSVRNDDGITEYVCISIHVSSPVIPLSDFYIIAGVVYQAPDLGSVISSRVVSEIVCVCVGEERGKERENKSLLYVCLRGSSCTVPSSSSSFFLSFLPSFLPVLRSFPVSLCLPSVCEPLFARLPVRFVSPSVKPPLITSLLIPHFHDPTPPPSPSNNHSSVVEAASEAARESF